MQKKSIQKFVLFNPSTFHKTLRFIIHSCDKSFKNIKNIYKNLKIKKLFELNLSFNF